METHSLMRALAQLAAPIGRDWEAILRSWSKPASDHEAERMENAERMIADALSDSEALASRDIVVFAQGSYKNNTNTRQDSDVDIAVLCRDVIFNDFTFAQGLTLGELGLVTSAYTFKTYKSEVGEALIAHFGNEGVTAGNKCFDIHENTYRVAADVVPVFVHHRHTRSAVGTLTKDVGVQFISDDGKRVVNWPAQHYANGVDKNSATGSRFKFITRALKRMRAEMDERGVAAAKDIPSFLIESLVFNVPNDRFGYESYVQDMRGVLAFLFNNTRDHADCRTWGEVNELKFLFSQAQPWTMERAHAFVSAAWDYMGFKD